MVYYRVSVMVYISKWRKYLFGRTLWFFFIGIIFQWAGVKLCGTLIWHLTYWTGDRRLVFLCQVIWVLSRFLIIHFVRVCQACGSATGMFVCVYSTLLTEKDEFRRPFDVTFSSEMWKLSSTSKSVSHLLLDYGIWSIIRVEILLLFPLCLSVQLLPT